MFVSVKKGFPPHLRISSTTLRTNIGFMKALVPTSPKWVFIDTRSFCEMKVSGSNNLNSFFTLLGKFWSSQSARKSAKNTSEDDRIFLPILRYLWILNWVLILYVRNIKLLITNNKQQITNNIQLPNYNDQTCLKFEYCKVILICNLEFVIWYLGSEFRWNQKHLNEF